MGKTFIPVDAFEGLHVVCEEVKIFISIRFWFIRYNYSFLKQSVRGGQWVSLLAEYSIKNVKKILTKAKKKMKTNIKHKIG